MKLLAASASRKALTALLALAFLHAPAYAESESLNEHPAPQADDLTVAQIVAKVMLANGGSDALTRLDGNSILRGHERVVSGDGVANEMAFQQIRKGAKLRIDLTVAGGGAGSSTVFDGASGWKAGGKWVSDLPADSVKVLKEDRDRQPSVFAHFGEASYSFKLIGRTTYKQVPVYAIEVSHGDHSPTSFFVDQNNFLVVGASYGHSGGDAAARTAVDTEYSEYRPVDGAMVPFKQTQLVNGAESLLLTLDAAELKSVIDDGVFKRPDQSGSLRLAHAVTVPVEYSQGELLIKVRVNSGEPLDFLLDTGASDTMVDRRTAAEHFLDKQGQMEISVAAGSVTTNASVVRKLEVGNLTLEDVHALILDLSPQARQLGRPVAGILGANVLSQFAVTIDYAKGMVTFTDALAYSAPAGAATVPFTQRPGLTVKANLNGRDEESFLLDTGAAFNHLPASAARRYVQGQPQHLTEGTGLDGRPVRLGTLVAESVSLGKQSVSKVNFTYPYGSDNQAGRGGFFQTSAAGILGNPFWQNFILTIDYHAQKLVLVPVAGKKNEASAEQSLSAGDTKLVIYRDYRAAETFYQKALLASQTGADQKAEAKALGRLGCLHRILAHDLNRPEQAKVAYHYFTRAQQLARKVGDREVEGRILADWSLLYSDNGQTTEAAQTMQAGLMAAPNDPFVNVDNAVHLYRAKLYTDMQKFVDKALFLDPSNWQALWYQLKLSEMFFDTARQMSTLKEILRFYPWSKLAREKLTAITNPPPMQLPAQGVPTP